MIQGSNCFWAIIFNEQTCVLRSPIPKQIVVLTGHFLCGCSFIFTWKTVKREIVKCWCLPQTRRRHLLFQLPSLSWRGGWHIGERKEGGGDPGTRGNITVSAYVREILQIGHSLGSNWLKLYLRECAQRTCTHTVFFRVLRYSIAKVKGGCTMLYVSWGLKRNPTVKLVTLRCSSSEQKASLSLFLFPGLYFTALPLSITFDVFVPRPQKSHELTRLSISPKSLLLSLFSTFDSSKRIFVCSFLWHFHHLLQMHSNARGTWAMGACSSETGWHLPFKLKEKGSECKPINPFVCITHPCFLTFLLTLVPLIYHTIILYLPSPTTRYPACEQTTELPVSACDCIPTLPRGNR